MKDIFLNTYSVALSVGRSMDVQAHDIIVTESGALVFKDRDTTVAILNKDAWIMVTNTTGE